MRHALRITALLCLAMPLRAQHRNVVLIAIDGLRGVDFASLTAKQTSLPNLAKFHAEGAVSEGLIGVFPTVTAPSMASLVTGVSPAVHGVLDNYAFDPERKMNASDSANEYAELIHVPTLWSAAHEAGLRTASVYWPTTTTAVMDADFPNHTQMRNYRDRLLYRAVATPGLVAEFEKEYGNLPTGSNSFNEQVITEMSLFLIKTRKPNLLMIYFQDLDHAEHKNGPQSPEAYEVLKKDRHRHRCSA
ncbi:MAG TPA: ectonucleotide pyrophosphatase/phosphodiesterase [Acidobacteriaceae bacterium]